MTEMLPAVFSMQSGLRERGGEMDVAGCQQVPRSWGWRGRGNGVQPCRRCDPSCDEHDPRYDRPTGHPGRLWASPGAMRLGQGGPVAAAGSEGCLAGLAARHNHWTIGWPMYIAPRPVGFGVDQGGGCRMAAQLVQAARWLGPLLPTRMFRLALIWVQGARVFR
jgi:hypothetical protein